jgi:hypothetical protein
MNWRTRNTLLSGIFGICLIVPLAGFSRIAIPTDSAKCSCVANWRLRLAAEELAEKDILYAQHKLALMQIDTLVAVIADKDRALQSAKTAIGNLEFAYRAERTAKDAATKMMDRYRKEERKRRMERNGLGVALLGVIVAVLLL